MTLNEAREVLAGAAWTHETPLVTLLDEVIERYDAPIVAGGKQYPSKITRAFAYYKHGYVSSGHVVQLLISLRQRYKMPWYEVEA